MYSALTQVVCLAKATFSNKDLFFSNMFPHNKLSNVFIQMPTHYQKQKTIQVKKQ